MMWWRITVRQPWDKRCCIMQNRRYFVGRAIVPRIYYSRAFILHIAISRLMAVKFFLSWAVGEGSCSGLYTVLVHILAFSIINQTQDLTHVSTSL